jgi:hypothetical protein
MYRRLIGCVAGACALTLAASCTAFAHAGGRSFAQTYPVATVLCQRAHANTLPSGLAASRSQVITACNMLENAFGPLVATVDNAESTYLSTIAAQRALVDTACARPVTNHAACQAARATRRSTDAAARSTLETAVAAFRGAVETNRQTFWATIRSLRTA